LSRFKYSSLSINPMNPMLQPWRKWKHITKIDPDKKITPRIIDLIIQSHTDAIMISGTDNVTRHKIKKVIKMLKPYDIPKILEPAHPKAIVYKGVDYIFVPTVFNTKNPLWINGFHRLWAKMDKNINWDMVIPEAYIILNPECKAAKYTGAENLKKDDVVAAAVAAEKYFNIPIIYIEYSGKFGDPKIVKAVKESLTKAHLIYGGGINTEKKAKTMAQYADSIVVGNTIYEGGVNTFLSTMRGSLRKDIELLNKKLKKLKELKEGEKKIKLPKHVRKK